ncbi:uncharacterized protein LOC129301285 [Prosopis cineraria]|uniref:uncharacterized protein LOC129289415 n=1 Tax=Prosopis cineraria TaxID=364024 RepID=UPI00240F90EC|nr:uncharacterized protein LOC129289415 [Prosopis cineraria]XP_054795834.1 uncharacterized protein LOC129301285 [Prosopis cineraria]
MAASVSVSESLMSVLNNSPSGLGKEEYTITHLAEDSDNNFDVITRDQIYKETMLSRLNFLSNYKTKSVLKSFPLENKQHDVYLLTRDDIRRHKKKYDFLHIGLVQVFVSPLHHRGCDQRVLVCLRDAKYPNFKDSIFAAFEMISLKKGFSNFNWFPNFSSSFSDLSKSNGLVITVEPHGLSFIEGSHTLAIEYRMCYKLMKGSLEPRTHLENPILELKTENMKVLAPRTFSGN